MMWFTLAVAALASSSTLADKALLPDIDTVLTKANNRAHAFAEQAVAMQDRLREQQQDSHDALSVKKDEYEATIGLLREQNEAISVNNSKLQVGNRELWQSNAKLFAELMEIRDRNAEMRATVQSIMDPVSTATLFIADSLKVTDDSVAEELQVLAPTSPKPTLDHFLSIASGHGISLLEIGGEVRSDPRDLIHALSTSLTEIKSAEDEGAIKLKAHFLASQHDILENQAQLNATQAKLTQAREELEEHREKLLGAKAHLQATSKQLKKRLAALSVFAGTVDDTVAAALDPKSEGKVNETVNETGKEPQGLLRQATGIVDRLAAAASAGVKASTNHSVEAAETHVAHHTLPSHLSLGSANETSKEPQGLLRKATGIVDRLSHAGVKAKREEHVVHHTLPSSPKKESSGANRGNWLSKMLW